jgi:hypothetical protein
MTSEKTSTALNRDAASQQSGPASEKQSAARAALEARAGRTLSDMEWNRARARLVEFASILRVWHLGVTNGESELRKAA